MATPTTGPLASVSFPADEFRAAIKGTMQMGAPSDDARKVTFIWPAENTHSAVTDPTGTPYDLAATPTSVQAERRVLVDCAVEFIGRPGATSNNTMGEFNSASLKLTLLDVDYDEIAGAPLVAVDEATYVVDYVAPPIGLFDVTVWQIYATAEDEG